MTAVWSWTVSSDYPIWLYSPQRKPKYIYKEKTAAEGRRNWCWGAVCSVIMLCVSPPPPSSILRQNDNSLSYKLSTSNVSLGKLADDGFGEAVRAALKEPRSGSRSQRQAFWSESSPSSAEKSDERRLKNKKDPGWFSVVLTHRSPAREGIKERLQPLGALKDHPWAIRTCYKGIYGVICHWISRRVLLGKRRKTD